MIAEMKWTEDFMFTLITKGNMLSCARCVNNCESPKATIVEVACTVAHPIAAVKIANTPVNTPVKYYSRTLQWVFGVLVLH